MRLDSAVAPPTAPDPPPFVPLPDVPPAPIVVVTPTALRGRLRRSLSASTVEGMLAEVVGGCAGGTMLTAWAMHLGAGAFELSLLAALPNLAQLVRLPGAWLVERAGARRVAIAAVATSRLVLLTLALLPLFGLSAARARALLLGVAAVSSLLSIVGNCGWTVWMGELVPERLRGRYFGRRTALATTASMASVLLASVVVDAARAAGHEEGALALLALVATLAGAATWALLLRQHAPSPPPRAHADVGLAAALGPLVDAAVRPLFVFQLVWNAALGLAAAFFTLYMLGPLGLGYSWVALHGLVSSTTRVLTAPAWGRAIDRHGARTVVAVASLALALAPLPWLLLTRARLWLLCLDPIFVGAFTAGHGLAMFDLPLRLTPRRGRAYHLAAFAMVGGLAFAAAAALGGAVGNRAGLGATTAMRALFVASAGGRALAALLALGVVDRRRR